MAESSSTHLSPETFVAEFKKHGVTHVVWLPDSETNFLYVLMKAEPSLTLVAVSREGLAFSTAAGLYAGGKNPVILIQNTGMMEAGDSMRGWGLGLSLSKRIISEYHKGKIFVKSSTLGKGTTFRIVLKKSV